MTDKPLPRPRQATVSGALILVGSVMLVLLAFQQVSTLGSIESQQAADDLISGPPFDGLGLSVDEVQTLWRVLGFIAAAAGTATAMLGWQVLRRSRSARLPLTLLAPVVLVAGWWSAPGFTPALVAAAIVMLWVQPTKDWLDGREPARPAPPARPVSAATAAVDPFAPPTGPPLAGPGTMPPPQQPQSSWDLAPPAAPRATSADPGATTNPYGAPSAPRAVLERPGKVTAACIATIVSSGVAFAGLLVALLYTLGNHDDLVTEIQKELDKQSYEGVSADSFANVAVGFFVVLLVWSVVAIGLAVATMRRSNGARITLVVSAVLAAIVSLLGVLVVVPLAFTAAGVATAILLLGTDAKAWFAAPR